MNQRKLSRRLLAMALSVVMVLGMLPAMAAAENLPAGTSGEIVSFEPLPEATAAQTVALDTPLEDLDFPETLMATVRFAVYTDEPVQDSGNTVQQEPEQNSESVQQVQVTTVSAVALTQEETADEGSQQDQVTVGEVTEENEEAPAAGQEAVDPAQEESDTGYTETTISVPVKWTASPDYDGNRLGVYAFTAETEGFTLSVETPTITVTVQEAAVKGTITAFDELTEDIRWQNTTEPFFPETLTGTVEGQTAKIPVTWEADHDYDSDSPATGLYVFTAKPGEGYAITAEMEAPRITVYIPAAKRMMLRMSGEGTPASPLEITTAAQLAEIAVLVNDGRLETFLFNDSSATVSLKLMNDLDLSSYGEGWNSGKGWEPIGSTSTYPFKGTFDGDNKKITGLFINRTEQLSGLFGYLSGCTVQNLGLEEVSITGGTHVGGIAGFVFNSVSSGSSVTNCHVTGTISGTDMVGGMVGYADGSVTNCYTTSTVTGTGNNVGGVVGWANGSVTNCYATGTVTGTGNNVGGVAGYAYSITNCYATGAVSGSDSVGGLTGSACNVKYCYATGTVTGTGREVGGVTGYAYSITNCAALNLSVSGGSEVGRVAGYSSGGTLFGNAAFSGMTVKVNNVDQPISGGTANNINGVDITSADITTGIYWATSMNWNNPTVWTVESGKLPILAAIPADVQDAAIPPHLVLGGSSSYFLGEGTSTDPYQISTAEQLAKLAELVNVGDTSYNNKHYKLTTDLDLSAYGKKWNSGKGWEPIGSTSTYPFKGTFDGDNKKITGLFINRTEQLSGLFGYLSGCTVQNLGLEEVSITGGTHVGGIAGFVFNSVSSGSSVTNCHVTGTISGTDMVGGMVGYADGSVTNCYTTSTVTGTGNNVGGVVGCAAGSVTNCYATGAVSGGIEVGGVAGYAYSIINCYATGAVSGRDSVGGVAGSARYVEYCYATGTVTGTGSNVGGVVGRAVGSVRNCAALNPSVSGGSEVGRVAGYSGGTFLDNAAFSGMTDSGTGKFGSIVNSLTDKNGMGFSTADIKADGTIGCRFDDTSIWTVENGKLPILQNVAGTQDGTIPPHLAGGSSPYFLGEGTSTAPYQIGTADQLAKLAELVNDSATNAAYGGKDIYYKLTANLDLSAYGKNFNNGEGWVPIGSTKTTPFKGNFDGGNKKIAGLSIIFRTEQFSGLFGFIDGGTVQNFGLEKVSINCGHDYVGGVAGFVKGGSSVTYCHVTGSVTSLGTDTGGIVGRVDGFFDEENKVANCYANASVTGGNEVGGIAGGVLKGWLTDCYATGSVSGIGNEVGGVAGVAQAYSIVTNCYATGAVSGNSEVGGVVGVARVYSIVRNCAALNPSVSGSSNVRRVVGFADKDITLFGNVAFSGMTGGGSSTGAGNPDGANVNSRQMNTASFWTTAGNWDTSGWDTSVWTIQDGKLPVLQNVGGTQSGESGLYLTLRDIAGAAVTLNEDTYTYTGNPILPSLTVTFDGATLVKDQHYTVTVTSTDGTGTSAGTNVGTVTLEIKGIGNFQGTKPGVTFQIVKADGPIAPAVTGAYTGNGNTFTYTVNAIPGAEYSTDNSTWQGSNEFTGFTTASPATTFYARIKETGTHKTGAVGKTAAVTFTKLENTQAPDLAYTVSGTNNSCTITITAVSGAEYKFGDDAWDSSNSKGGYTSAQTVMVQIRYTKTATHNPSSVNSVSINLAKQNKTAPPAFELGYTYNTNVNQFIVTIPERTNAEYSFDGTAYSQTRTITAAPGDSVTGYMRYMETDAYNQSSAATASLTLPIPVTTITVSGTGGQSSITTNGGTLQMLAAVMPIEATQAVTWSVSGSGATISATGLLTATGNGTVTVRATAKDGTGVYGEKTITISGQTTGGGGNGGSSSSGSSSTTTTRTPEKKPNQPVTATASVTATAGANGTARASVPDKAVTDAIAKAQSDAASQGKTANGICVGLDVTMPKGATAMTVVLTRSSLNSLVSAGVSNLEINGFLVRVSIDKKALAEILKQSTGNISIAIAPKTNLSDAAKKIIGRRPVYDITVGYGSGKTVSSFGGGIVTISISYSLGKNEAVGGLYAVYVDEKGNATRIAGSAYDENSGRVIFTTTHFSQYAIGYTAPSAKFTDISSHWAKESIDYVVGRGLLSGTSETAFSPNSAMTRGVLVTALGRLAGVDTKLYTTNSFTDVKADSTFRPYIEWAYKKGIIQGIGNQQFAPDRAITREEIAVIFVNYAKATGYTLPVTREEAAYTDASSIGSVYKNAVTAMQQAGIMMGENNNVFSPGSSATRAEVAAMLTRYIKLTIDPATALGWEKNDSGQWMYFKDGKALIGWQTINGKVYCFDSNGGAFANVWKQNAKGEWFFLSSDSSAVTGWKDIGENGNTKRYYFDANGVMVTDKWLENDGKWYYFYTDGSLAVNTTIDGYKVDENGVRQSK